MTDESIFSRIIKGEIPADKVFENERIIAFKDIAPLAPIHILIVPKKEIKDLQSIAEQDLNIVSEIVSVAQLLAERFDIKDGYRLVTNVGPSAGQSVFHLHFHLIGGKKLGVPA